MLDAYETVERYSLRLAATGQPGLGAVVWDGAGMAQASVRLTTPMRTLLAYVCALVLTDTVFFTALTPLLPHYVQVAGLTKAGAGILVAAYPLFQIGRASCRERV